MGRLTPGALISFALWMGLAVGAFIITFQFDKPIEIYAFGTAGWPRAIIVLIGMAAAMQLFDEWRYGSEKKEDAAAVIGKEGEPLSAATVLQVLLLLGLPIVYALLLEAVGFYVLTPFFLIAIILLGGERRPLRVLAVASGIYVFLLLVFTKLLYVGLPVGTIGIFYDVSNWLLVLLRGN